MNYEAMKKVIQFVNKNQIFCFHFLARERFFLLLKEFFMGLPLAYLILKDTHREKAPQSISPALTESVYKDIWVVGASNQLLIRDSYTETKFPKKLSSYWQNAVLCIPFSTHHSICLDIGF